MLPVVGWTDLFMGRPCSVSVTRVRNTPVDITGKPAGEPATAYLVYGGNSGVRVLDGDRELQEWESHLPPGWGMPVVWVEDAADLPDDVRAVVESD